LCLWCVLQALCCVVSGVLEMPGGRARCRVRGTVWRLGPAIAGICGVCRFGVGAVS